MKTIDLNPKNLEVYISPDEDLVKLVNSRKKADIAFVKKSMSPFVIKAVKKGKKIPLDSSQLKITLIMRD